MSQSVFSKASVLDFYGQPAALANPPANMARMYYNSVLNQFIVIDSSGTSLLGSGSVTSVAGTANQITSSGGATPTLSIPSSFIAPGSIAATTSLSGVAITGTGTFTQSQTDATAGVFTNSSLTLTLAPVATKTGATAILNLVNSSVITQAVSGRMRGLFIQLQPSSTGTLTRLEGINVSTVPGNSAGTANANITDCIGIYADTELVQSSGIVTRNTSIKVQSGAATAGGTITQDDGIRIETPTSNGTLTHHAGLHIITGQSTGANNADGWAILVDAAADKTQLGILQTLGKLTSYNSIATVSNGIPSELATVDLTGQAAAISATTAYAVPASGAGMYRVSYVASITTVDGTSAVLGGANGFQVIYTDGDDSVVKTSNPTTVTVSAVNSTATSISGTLIANCKASTNLQYAFGYTGVGGQMRYNLHIKVEAM